MKTQTGRSMIEMLGVLAVVGVLSIGGLAGYTKAMNAYKANQIIDYMSHVDIEILRPKMSFSDGDDCADLLDEDMPAGMTACMCGHNGPNSLWCSFKIASAGTRRAFAQKVGLYDCTTSHSESCASLIDSDQSMCFSYGPDNSTPWAQEARTNSVGGAYWQLETSCW